MTDNHKRRHVKIARAARMGTAGNIPAGKSIVIHNSVARQHMTTMMKMLTAPLTRVVESTGGIIGSMFNVAFAIGIRLMSIRHHLIPGNAVIAAEVISAYENMAANYAGMSAGDAGLRFERDLFHALHRCLTPRGLTVLSECEVRAQYGAGITTCDIAIDGGHISNTINCIQSKRRTSKGSDLDMVKAFMYDCDRLAAATGRQLGHCIYLSARPSTSHVDELITYQNRMRPGARFGFVYAAGDLERVRMLCARITFV